MTSVGTPTRRIEIELAGRSFRIIGAAHAVSAAIENALLANGAQAAAAETPPQLLIVSHPLMPDAVAGEVPDYRQLEAIGRTMVDGGRILFLLSAMAAVPMRRAVAYSASMSAAAITMRGLAMQLAPTVLVNAVGCGLVGSDGALLSGDSKMRSHTAVAGDGTIEDIVDAVLFMCDPLNSYTTGQLLTVDGGWSIGYGRNF